MSPESIPLPASVRSLIDGYQERRARTTADRSLAGRLCQAVRQDAAEDLGALSYYVHDGAIAVYGVVPSAEARRRALDVAAKQPGARRILDHLRVEEA